MVKAVTGKVALHPDAQQATHLEKNERRAVRKCLSAKSAFTTLHMLGMITTAAFPVKTRATGRNTTAAMTQSSARHTRGAKKAGSACDILSSEEDDEGL